MLVDPGAQRRDVGRANFWIVIGKGKLLLVQLPGSTANFLNEGLEPTLQGGQYEINIHSPSVERTKAATSRAEVRTTVVSLPELQ